MRVGLPIDLGQAAAPPIRVEQGRRMMSRSFHLGGRVFERKGDETLKSNMSLRPKAKFVRRRSQLQLRQRRTILEPWRNAPDGRETGQWLVNDVRPDLPGIQRTRQRLPQNRP